MANPESLKHLIRIMDCSPEFAVSPTLLDKALLRAKGYVRERIIVLLARKNPDAEFLTSFIATLKGDYLKINDKSKRPTFEVDQVNGKFLQVLKNKGLISSFPEHKGVFKVYHRTK